MTEDDLAMIAAAERVSPALAIAAVMAISPPPGITVTVDWPAFLGRSQAEITDLLTEHYASDLTEGLSAYFGSAWSDADGWASQFSRDLYQKLARSLPEMARWRAEQTRDRVAF